MGGMIANNVTDFGKNTREMRSKGKVTVLQRLYGGSLPRALSALDKRGARRRRISKLTMTLET
jgi:carbamoylphosphate synthase large subunit